MILFFEKIKTWIKVQSFQPGFLALFINPFYLIRRGLYREIRITAPALNGILLDFGCGRKPYKNLFKVDQYIGVDIEQSGHSHELSEVDVYYDGKTIPFPDGHFDSVFCSEVFEHVFELDRILSEINRVMKKNGKMLFTVPFVWNDHEIPYDFGRYTTFGISYLMEKHGFKVIEINKSTNFVQTIVQLWILYIFHVTKTKNKILNLIINVVLISPFTIVGLIFSGILPRRMDLYHNSIVLIEKT
jgi:SAM-dependent methyltransferase